MTSDLLDASSDDYAMTTRDNEDDDNDIFKSLHQLVPSLSEVSKNSSETEGYDSSNKGLTSTPSNSPSSESDSSSHKALHLSSVLLENLVEDVCLLDLRVSRNKRIILEEYGEVVKIQLQPGSPGSVSIHATFLSQQEAEYAVECLNGIEADGRILGCRLVEALPTTKMSSSFDSYHDEEKETTKPMIAHLNDIQEPMEGVEVEILPAKAEEAIQDAIEDKNQAGEESKEVTAPPKAKLVEWALDPETEPAGISKDALEGQQKISVHGSERLPRFLRRVAVEATKSPSLSNFPDRDLPPHRIHPISQPSQIHLPQQISSYIPQPTPFQSRGWSAYETMYSSGSTSPVSVTRSHLQAQPSVGLSHLPHPSPPNPYYQQQQQHQPYQPNFPHAAGYNAYPYNPAYNPFKAPFIISSPSPMTTKNPRDAVVDRLLKEAGIDNLQKLRMLAPDLRSLEFLIADLSKEYPCLLPTFGDRFYVKNILRQYLQL